MNTVPNRPFLRRAERWLVGLAMAAMAWLLEKAMLRSIKRDGAKP